ncbi:MAG: hypothetical protein HGA71_03200 [Azonexaceae bacterium]|nr:hypothetical protein [Azonexaceae bacterium]
MLEALKNFCVEMLRLAGYPELADWLNDAGRKAVKVVARVVARSVGLKGRIDDEAAREIEAIRNRAPAGQGAGAVERDEDDSIAGLYLLILNNIVAAGQAYPSLALDGFLHGDDCASLWTFDRGVRNLELALSIDPFSGKPYIALQNSGVEIHLLEKIGGEALIALNTQIGNNPDVPQAALATTGRPRVVAIYEHHLEVVVSQAVAAPTKRDPERKKLLETKSEIVIPGTHEGIQALMNSLAPALLARASSAERLKGLVKGSGWKS